MNRRQWLIRWLALPATTAAGAILGGMILDVWLAAGRFSTQHWSEVIEVDQLPQEGSLPLPGKRLALLCQGERLAALSLECTHLGCLVNAVDQGFYCPCHGSAFGPTGELWSGPAPRRLDWLPVTILNGKVWVRIGGRQKEPVWVRRRGELDRQGDGGGDGRRA